MTLHRSVARLSSSSVSPELPMGVGWAEHKERLCHSLCESLSGSTRELWCWEHIGSCRLYPGMQTVPGNHRRQVCLGSHPIQSTTAIPKGKKGVKLLSAKQINPDPKSCLLLMARYP